MGTLLGTRISQGEDNPITHCGLIEVMVDVKYGWFIPRRVFVLGHYGDMGVGGVGGVDGTFAASGLVSWRIGVGVVVVGCVEALCRG